MVKDIVALDASEAMIEELDKKELANVEPVVVLLTSVNTTSTTVSQLSVAVMVGTAGIASQSTLTSAGSDDKTGAVVSVTVMVWV